MGRKNIFNGLLASQSERDTKDLEPGTLGASELSTVECIVGWMGSVGQV